MNPERLAAALRLLRYAGDITPVAARMLTRINDEEQTGYDRAQLVQILIDHQRAGPERCSCGWGEWGRSHAAHVADLRVAGTVHHLGGPQAHWLASMLAMRQGRELSVLPGRAGR